MRWGSSTDDPLPARAGLRHAGPHRGGDSLQCASRPALRLCVDSGADLFGGGRRTEEFATCDQYTIQGDLFSKAVREGGEVPTPLEDSIRNMAVIEALYRSARESAWVRPDAV